MFNISIGPGDIVGYLGEQEKVMVVSLVSLKGGGASIQVKGGVVGELREGEVRSTLVLRGFKVAPKVLFYRLVNTLGLTI